MNTHLLIKPITELDVDIPELESFCEKHKTKHKIIIGKHYFLWPPEQVFKVCEKCSPDRIQVHDRMEMRFEELILDYYHKNITSDDLKNKIRAEFVEFKNKDDLLSEEYERDLKDFFKMVPYFIGLIILLLGIKYLFF